jgi:MFS family permease
VRRIWRALLPPWADRNLRLILATRVWMSVGRAVAATVTALYLAAIGFSAVEIGTLFVGVTVVSALMSTVIGLLADRFGRKPFLVAVPLLTAGAGAVYAESRATALLFVAAALGSFGRGSGAGAGNVGPYQPAESALVADSMDGSRRAAAFGRIAFASTLGALVGGLLAEVVRTTPHMSAAEATAAYRPAFLIAAALAVLTGLVALLLKEPPRSGGRDGEPRPGFRWPRRSWPALWRFWVTNATNGAGIGLFGSFMSYWLNRRYGVTPGTIGLLFAIVNLGSLASALAAERVARLIGTVRAIVVVRAVGGVLLVPMVLAPAFWMAGAVYLVRMVLQRVGLPLRQSFTQDMADPEERASLAALSNLPAQATMAGGQVTAGYLFDEVSLAAPFELAAVFLVANAVLYGLLFSRRPPRRAVLPDAGAPELAEAMGTGELDIEL